MSPHLTPEPTLPADWAAVLERIEQALRQAIAQTAEPVPPAPPAEPTGSAVPERFGQHLAQLEARVRRAEQEAEAADAVLAAGAGQAEGWLAAVRAASGRLAGAAGRAI